MKAKSKVLVTLSTMTAIMAAAAAYAVRVEPTDWPTWLSGWFIAHRQTLILWLLGLTVIGAVVEWTRAITSSNRAEKEILQKVVSEFANSHFQDSAKWNRMTLFKAVPGWKALPSTLWRLRWWPFDKPDKARGCWRIQMRGRYLIPYARADTARNRRSSAAFRVDDSPDLCEGVAGLVWEQQYYQVDHLPKFKPGELRAAVDNGFPGGHPRAAEIRTYMEKTNVTDPVLLGSLQHYAQHFMGFVVKGTTGAPWGVLLLDSESDKCPFSPKTGGFLKKEMSTFTLTLGKIVS